MKYMGVTLSCIRRPARLSRLRGCHGTSASKSISSRCFELPKSIETTRRLSHPGPGLGRCECEKGWHSDSEMGQLFAETMISGQLTGRWRLLNSRHETASHGIQGNGYRPALTSCMLLTPQKPGSSASR